MTQFFIEFEASQKNMRILERFLEQSGTSPGLSNAIMTQVSSRLSEASQLRESEVLYLGLTSTSLREALWCQVCMGHLELHVFFSAWGRMDMDCFLSFCNAAMSMCSFV